MTDNKKRLIAFYLPQYHPIKENDQWWGEGFTEWRNVAKAKPLFRGHYQPHLPADLGFYDLRLPEVREKQAELAKQYGIYGFCYYHYWFNGDKLLERPLEEMLASGKPDLPFMICWANENWTRRWDGGNNEVIKEQHYSFDDDLEHIKYLLPFLKDPRYIRVDGKAVIAIYRSTLLPNIEKTIEIWRQEAAKEGVELYVCRIESFGTYGDQYMKPGIDAAIEFQPTSRAQADFLKKWSSGRLLRGVQRVCGCYRNLRLSYKNYVAFMDTHSLSPNYKRYLSLVPMWDNSARKSRRYLAFEGSTPALYKKWLSATLRKFKPYSKDENLVFINAWNEWGEGCHLEPCAKWGRAYLEATKDAVNKS